MNPFYESQNNIFDVFESKNLEFPEHLHSHIEITFVCKGKLTVRIMGRPWELTEGDCVVIFPQQVHSYQSMEENLTRLFLLDYSLAGSYLNSIRTYVPSCPFILSKNLPEDAMLAIKRLCKLACNRLEPNDFAVCSAWVQVLFAAIFPLLMLEKRNQSEGEELVCRLLQYIMAHFQEPLTLEILARKLHISKYYISHIFSNRLKINFRQYLNRIRLEYVIQLMKTTTSSLTDLWAEAGFNSQRSFNRVFVDVIGMTPMEYRKCLACAYKVLPPEDDLYKNTV